MINGYNYNSHYSIVGRDAICATFLGLGFGVEPRVSKLDDTVI